MVVRRLFEAQLDEGAIPSTSTNLRVSYSGITSDFQSDDRSSILRPRSTNEYKEHGGELGSTG